MLKKEFSFYLNNQAELLKKYNGRFLVIVGEEVKGDYSAQQEAYSEAIKSFEVGTFLIQKCEPGNDAYTQTFHSRVTFA